MCRQTARLVALLFALAIAVAAPTARAADLEAALAHFTTDTPESTAAGIRSLATSGDPRAVVLLQALREGRVIFSAREKKVVYRDRSDALIDAVTGAPSGPPYAIDFAFVRLDDRLRSVIDAALATLQPQAPTSPAVAAAPVPIPAPPAVPPAAVAPPPAAPPVAVAPPPAPATPPPAAPTVQAQPSAQPPAAALPSAPAPSAVAREATPSVAAPVPAAPIAQPQVPLPTPRPQAANGPAVAAAPIPLPAPRPSSAPQNGQATPPAPASPPPAPAVQAQAPAPAPPAPPPVVAAPAAPPPAPPPVVAAPPGPAAAPPAAVAAPAPEPPPVAAEPAAPSPAPPAVTAPASPASEPRPAATAQAPEPPPVTSISPSEPTAAPATPAPAPASPAAAPEAAPEAAPSASDAAPVSPVPLAPPEAATAAPIVPPPAAPEAATAPAAPSAPSDAATAPAPPAASDAATQAPALAVPPPDAAQATPDTTQPAPDAATAAPDAATAAPDTPAADQAPAAAADTPAAAPAQPPGPPPTLAEALARFLEDDFSETDTGVTAVAASGDPRAATIVEALQDGRLLFSTQERKVYYKDKSDRLFDAETGDELTGSPPVDMAPVRINNRLRRTIDATLGGLRLVAPDAAVRLDAARAVFKSRDESMLPAVDAALAKETNERVKQALLEARAVLVLNSSGASEADKLDAVAILRARGDQEALNVLAGLPADTAFSVNRAARDAVIAIQSRLAVWETLQNTWYGLSLGSVLLLAAIGLAITFGVMGVINMAHGEMVMIGAYVTFVVQEAIRTHNPALFDYSLLIAVPLAFLIAGIIGILIEQGIIRFLYGRPLETLLATWGLSLILQQAVRTVFGPTNKEVGNPSWMSGAFELGQITITYNRMWIIVFTMGVFLALLALLRYTRLGLEMRAVTQNRAMAASMGIRTARVDALTFGLGSGIAGIAGVALSQIDNVSPNLGQGYIIDSFMVVVFGGVGNLWGTLVGAFSLGIANKFLEPFAGAVLAKIAILVLIILFIQKRPRGLFALKGRAVEA